MLNKTEKIEKIICSFRDDFNLIKKNIKIENTIVEKNNINFYKKDKKVIIKIESMNIKVTLYVNDLIASVLLGWLYSYSEFNKKINSFFGFKKTYIKLKLENFYRIREKKDILNFFKEEILKLKEFKLSEDKYEILLKENNKHFNLCYFKNKFFIKNENKHFLKIENSEMIKNKKLDFFNLIEFIKNNNGFWNNNLFYHNIREIKLENIYIRNGEFYHKVDKNFMLLNKNINFLLKLFLKYNKEAKILLCEKIKDKTIVFFKFKKNEEIYFYSIIFEKKKFFIKKKEKVNNFFTTDKVYKNDFIVFKNDSFIFFYNLKNHHVIKTKQISNNYFYKDEKNEDFYFYKKNNFKKIKIPKFVLDNLKNESCEFNVFYNKINILDSVEKDIKIIFLNDEFYFLNIKSKLFNEDKKKLYKNLMNNKEILINESSKILLKFSI